MKKLFTAMALTASLVCWSATSVFAFPFGAYGADSEHRAGDVGRNGSLVLSGSADGTSDGGRDISGLSITPENENLFSIANMLPGETAYTRLLIENREADAFDLSLTVENLADETDPTAQDLLKVLQIIVTLPRADGTEEVVADFPAYGGTYDGQPFGQIPGDTSTVIGVSIGMVGRLDDPALLAELEHKYQTDGLTVGNKFQGATASLRWTFSASRPVPDPVPPPPADTTPVTPPGTPPATPIVPNTPATPDTPVTPGTPAAPDGTPGVPGTPVTPAIEAATAELPLGQEFAPAGSPDIPSALTIDEETPLGPAEVPLLVNEEPVPFSDGDVKAVPQTGEAPLWYNLGVGFMLVLLGCAFLLAGKRSRKDKARAAKRPAAAL